jgi:hypothetical protein
MCENALHDLTLIKMIVSPFVDAGAFLIRYANGPYEMNTSPIKEVRMLFLTKQYSFT